MRGQPIKKVEELTYFGTVVTSNTKNMQDIERRKADATRAFEMLRHRMWSRRETSLNVKIKVFNAIVI